MTSQALYKPICWQDRGHFVLFPDKGSVCLKLSKFLSCLRRHWDKSKTLTRRQQCLSWTLSFCLSIYQSFSPCVCFTILLSFSISLHSSQNASLQCLVPFHLLCECVSADKWNFSFWQWVFLGLWGRWALKMETDTGRLAVLLCFSRVCDPERACGFKRLKRRFNLKLEFCYHSLAFTSF